ncbi:exodeoxyribonuclease V gamma chain [Gordonia hirsuta DSM 44140 = NBRC 16056]|uniref:RecBCD enzyme subunit RecC n=1 Tax=Gordonia hirsuta DSM 44140 = NBRC 16056 TaxID=1121927 RepID=L7L7S0_9ACTN|nr:exodeoxyribonuclease V subunit gamma [Gordonia hirsuta]GAC56063.1 exodeoxyribonuclease V gamma chain [Gordonia hirsuta DSM 44140 = NBRC 16056]
MLTVHRAERVDVLADVLADQFATPLPDPLQAELVVVPARGVERWLSQRLALRLGAAGASDGIAANIDFPSPDSLLRRVVLATAADPDAAQAWYTDRLVWPVLQMIDAHLHDERLSVLRRHLSGPDGAGRRLSAATTIAELFAAYGRQRPTMLADWAVGRDTDGAGRRLDPTLDWQPWFWRLVREQIAAPHLAEQLDDVAAVLRTDPAVVDLPERFAFFGATRIPEALRSILAALAEHREVSVMLPHPSDALWHKVAAHPGRVPRARAVADQVRPAHPLLAALSRDVQELQEVLSPQIGADVLHRLPARSPSLLAAIQEGLADDRLSPRSGPAPDDSLEVHACHGPERQVEVLRDRLLRLFDDHPDLQPRDVLIMCPDVEAFAPLIQGAFGQTGLDHPGFSLRVRLADRGLRETNEVLDVLAAVVDLAAGRVRSGELLDLLGLPAVQRRFGLSDDDLETLAGWIERAGVRWGIDEVQRERFGMGGFPQGTAAVGRDRLLLGVLAEESENQWLGSGLPLDGVESTKVDLAGRFAEFVDRLGRLLRALDERRSAPEWAHVLSGAVDALTESAPDTQWQRVQAISMLTEALDVSGAAEAVLGRDDIREMLGRLLAARPTRANFCTGELTVATLTPMRSVPHRAVVLLGMDAESFPRSGSIDGDDILRRVPLIGERDRADEDRQVFLDALGSAVDHLLVFYTGADPVTGAVVPPPVLVSELIETADTVSQGSTGVVHRHTLHAFDERNFRPGPGTAPLSYDSRLLRGARALAAVTAGSVRATDFPVAAETVLPPVDPTVDIDLADLIAVLQSPAERFVRDRLGAVLPDHDETHPEELDVQLDGLQTWKIGDRYLQHFLAGVDSHLIESAEIRRGTLPPFDFGRQVLESVRDKAEAVGVVGAQHRSGHGDTVDVRVRLADGRRVYGTVPDVFGDRLVTVGYSKLSAKQRLASWIRLLMIAAGASYPITEALTIGAARSGTGAQISRLRRPDDPLALIEQLVAVRDAALRAPLWLPPTVGDDAAQSFGSGRADRALARIRSERGFVVNDRYVNWLLFDDPGRGATVDQQIDLAAAAPFAELDPMLPDLSAAGVSGAAARLIGVAVTIYRPLRERETSR